MKPVKTKTCSRWVTYFIMINLWLKVKILEFKWKYHMELIPTLFSLEVFNSSLFLNKAICYWWFFEISCNKTTCLLYMIMCMLLSATSTHSKWELMLHCPTLNKVFLLLLSYSCGTCIQGIFTPGDQRILWIESRDLILWAHNGVTWMFALQHEQGCLSNSCWHNISYQKWWI